MDTPFGRKKIPFASGTEYRVVCGGIMAGSIRSLIETPLEYAKVYSESSPESRSLVIFFFSLDTKATWKQLEIQRHLYWHEDHMDESVCSYAVLFHLLRSL